MRKDSETASLVVTTRNRPDELARCLTAIAGGRILPEEVLIVDQSEDERSRHAADDARRLGLRVRYIRQPAVGLGAGQNEAFSHAASRVVAVTDDDCVPDTEWLATILAVLRGRPDLAAVTGRVVPLPAEGPKQFPVALRTSEVAREFAGRTLPWPVGSGNNFAVRRDWFERIGGCDPRLGPGSPGKGAVDIDLFHRLLAAGGRIRYEPQSIVLHERTSWRGRLSRRFPYGHGMGAASVFWMRAGDRYGLEVLARWLVRRVGRLLRASLRLRLRLVVEEIFIIGGTLCGIAHATRRQGP